MATYLTSSFSLQMVGEEKEAQVKINRISLDEMRGAIVDVQYHRSHAPGRWGHSTGAVGARNYRSDIVRAVGHEGTALALTKILGVATEVNRMSITLRQGDTLYVIQPTGRRLQPGEELATPDLACFILEVISTASAQFEARLDCGECPDCGRHEEVWHGVPTQANGLCGCTSCS